LVLDQVLKGEGGGRRYGEEARGGWDHGGGERDEKSKSGAKAVPHLPR